MDNNGNFEQQFTQNLKATAAPAPMATSTSSSASKLPLVIAIALAAITLVESIALVITLSNYFAITSGEDEGYEVPVDEVVDANYVYDNNYDLTAINFTCTAEDGSYYNLTTDNQFEQYNGAGSLAASGSYTIKNDSLISLSGSNKVLYYDGFDIADGLTVYICEEVVTEANTNDSEAE